MLFLFGLSPEEPVPLVRCSGLRTTRAILLGVKDSLRRGLIRASSFVTNFSTGHLSHVLPLFLRAASTVALVD